MSNKKQDVTIIYVVRHGESASNVFAHENPNKPASHYGEYGSALTQKGREQAELLAERLQNVHFTAVYSSDLTRARETAEILAKKHTLPVTTDRKIRERFFGEPMSNRIKKEIEIALLPLNEHGKFAFKYFMNGESGYDVVKRFQAFLKTLITKHKNDTILLVCHSYLMRSFLINVGFAKYDELPSGSIKNTGYFIVETDGHVYRIIDRHGITRNRGYDDEE